MDDDGRAPADNADPDRAGAPGRRQDLRIPVDADIRIVEPFEACGVVLNASVGGLRISIDREIPIGSSCTVEVWLDGALRKRLAAKVAWSKEHPDGWVLGLDVQESTAPPA